MIRAGLGAWRLTRGVAHLLHGMAIVARRFPSLAAEQRAPYIQWWSTKMLRLVGIRLEVIGKPRPGAALVVANHVSWLDIAVIHAACPQARFVSKADVLRWPLLGWLIREVGTLFIERERKRDALRVVHEVAASLARGETVAVFPEGTTGAGDTVLPFHANLLQAAIADRVPVQAVALRYLEPGERFSSTARYVGGMTLVASIWRVVRARGLAVRVQFLLSEGSTHADRRALAAHLRDEIQQALNESA
ncbi:lysophospholipid acyltransferase family protein [Ideonella sp.]|uniref:lysophospholipid acyltransferase family protein n=1 Tax=Ideonella sp. TaxID=1929293 RepID=UPI002B48BFA7|nr:lysophospholipid acyltransferase family protein [Ideonella sp.]HJV72060.1 lysophospholipid acyltransferase family protein [Ideonella sp.]